MDPHSQIDPQTIANIEKFGLSVINSRDPIVRLDSSWPFRDADNTACFTCPRVIEGSKITFVSHDYADGYWQFLDDCDHSQVEPMLVSMKNVASKHPEILELADLPLGWQASRETAVEQWNRYMNGAQ